MQICVSWLPAGRAREWTRQIRSPKWQVHEPYRASSKVAGGVFFERHPANVIAVRSPREELVAPWCEPSRRGNVILLGWSILLRERFPKHSRVCGENTR